VGFIVGAEIYDHLEKVVDRFEEGQRISGIVIGGLGAHDPDHCPDRHRLVFDFLNGLHDAANSIATIVSTGCCAPLCRGLGGLLQLHCFRGVRAARRRRHHGTGIVSPA
jgi:hypothetical protein